MAVEVKIKKWGNSMGVIIPSEAVERLNLKPDEKIVIEINRKENILAEMFGTMKSKKTARQMLDETRKEMESKWMK